MGALACPLFGSRGRQLRWAAEDGYPTFVAPAADDKRRGGPTCTAQAATLDSGLASGVGVLYGSLFACGLLLSMHCVGMCGGFVALLSAQTAPNACAAGAALIRAAASASALGGAAVMASFGAGTIPALLLVAYGARIFTLRLRQRLFAVSGVFLLALGAAAMWHGLQWAHGGGMMMMVRAGR